MRNAFLSSSAAALWKLNKEDFLRRKGKSFPHTAVRESARVCVVKASDERTWMWNNDSVNMCKAGETLESVANVKLQAFTTLSRFRKYWKIDFPVRTAERRNEFAKTPKQHKQFGIFFENFPFYSLQMFFFLFTDFVLKKINNLQKSWGVDDVET